VTSPLPTLLLVDEVRWFRELGESFLSQSGRVLSCSSAVEALRIARRERPHVIITALELRDPDGSALCREVRNDPDIGTIPVVIVAGNEQVGSRARAIRAGASDVIARPVSRVVLVEAIRRLIRFEAPRERPRASLCVPVRVEASGVPGILLNLSPRGAFVEMEVPLPHGRDLTLAFSLPDSGARLRVTARVVWTRVASENVEGSRARGGTGRGQGLRFTALDPGVERSLAAFVAEGSRGPAAVLWGAP
jgi:CheY-like chemotaxis protein